MTECNWEVGQRVLMSNYTQELLATITAVNSRWVTTEKGWRFRTTDGRETGTGHSYVNGRYKIRPATKEDEDRIAQREVRRKLLSRVDREVQWSELSNAALQQILDLVHPPATLQEVYNAG